MRTIKQILIIALVLMLGAQIGTAIYLGSSDRDDRPTITCPQGILEISAKDNESVLLAGVAATDNQDGDLTERIIVASVSKLISKDTAKVTYLVFDSDDNMASLVRYIRYTDYQKPQFKVKVPLVYSDSGEVELMSRLGATDVVDGDISDRVRVSTLVATDNSQIYDITIQVTNSMGDTAWQVLPVLRLASDPLRPVVSLKESLVYVDKGGEFDAKQYLSSVTLSQGVADLADVKIEGTVDTDKVGTYRVFYTYTANDKVGMAILTVAVH